MILTHGANSLESGGGDFVEIGGRKYPVVKIGNQLWMAENLDFAYQGLALNAAGTPTTPGAWYNGDSYREAYGLLYNHYAVDYINSHLSEIGIPSGWHVPTKAEYETLFSSVGGINNTPSVLRDASWGGSDQYGFCAKPGGYYFNGSYSTVGTYAWFWTATMDGANAFKYLLGTDAYLEPDDVRDAFSVRLVKDAT